MRRLPVSCGPQAAAEFSAALRSVFVATTKLAVFHALFGWLTFRWLSVAARSQVVAN